jgi:hypothetical protein
MTAQNAPHISAMLITPTLPTVPPYLVDLSLSDILTELNHLLWPLLAKLLA